MAPMRPPRPRPCVTHWPRRALDWLCAGREDYRAFQQRRRTRPYRANRSLCLAGWSVAAALLLLCNSTGCIVVIALTATLSCFAVLDPE